VKSFYGAKYDDASMIVETKVLNNFIYCYYTYYRQGISDVNSRPGSYFAITLKTDAFISSFRLLYQIFDITYYRYVYGELITADKARKYTEPSFDKYGKQIEDGPSKLLSSTISASDISRLDDTFIANAGPSVTLHPFDLDGFDVAKYKKAEKLIVSQNAQTPRERERVVEFQKRIEFVKVDAEKKLKSVIDKERCMRDETEHRSIYFTTRYLRYNKNVQSTQKKLNGYQNNTKGSSNRTEYLWLSNLA